MKKTERVTITFQPTEEVRDLLTKAQRGNPNLNRTIFINEALRLYLTSFKGKWAAQVMPATKAA